MVQIAGNEIKVVALAGGVGGAKLVHGLALVLPTHNLTVVVNTGDDFTHYGLRICPDLDTVCYTLAGLANPHTGWGRVDESWQVMKNLTALNGETWFQLGDQDLATHLERTRRLAAGESLSAVTRSFCQAWGVQADVLPMTDQQVATWVATEDEGCLPFQEYFVHLHCEPVVRGFHFAGVENANPAPGVLDAFEAADLVVICPSNPWVSVGPILAVPGIAEILARKTVAAVSPIVGGQAIKGPAAKMYQELGITPSAVAVARQYQTLLKHFVMDTIDKAQTSQVAELGIEVLATNTVMKTVKDRRQLAEDVLLFCGKEIGKAANI